MRTIVLPLLLVSALVVAGCGYGAQPDQRDSFRAECEVLADAFATEGAAWVAEGYAEGPARVQFQAKDRIAWEEFKRRLAAHSPEGAALTMRGVQARRPSLYALTDQLGAMTVPTLIVTDRPADSPCAASERDETALRTRSMHSRAPESDCSGSKTRNSSPPHG